MSYQSAYTGAQLDNGAVVESGSNANGKFTRWADGTLICTHTLVPDNPDIAIGSLFRGAETAWTFPYAFVGNPSIFGMPVNGTAYLWVVKGATAASTTIGYFALMSATTTTQTPSTAMTAIGRWK